MSHNSQDVDGTGEYADSTAKAKLTGAERTSMKYLPGSTVLPTTGLQSLT